LTNCEGCGADLDPPNAVFGVEIPEVYDGVLYWACASCDYAFPRQFGFARRNDESARAVLAHNLNRAAEQAQEGP
jgi:hypothetical protein